MRRCTMAAKFFVGGVARLAEASPRNSVANANMRTTCILYKNDKSNVAGASGTSKIRKCTLAG